MGEKNLNIIVNSEIIQLNSLYYELDKISSSNVVIAPSSAWKKMTSGSLYVLIITFNCIDRVLFSTRNKEEIYKVYEKIKQAKIESKRGNKIQSTSFNMYGNVVNQQNSKFFDKGYIQGSVNHY